MRSNTFTGANKFVWLAMAALFCVMSAHAGEKPYEETRKKRGWTIFLHPIKKTATEQLAYVKELREAGRTKTALRQALALTIYWPSAPEAAEAQFLYARTFEDRKNLFKAFDEYEYLIKCYTGRFPYDEVLERQFNIATYLMNARKGTFLLFKGFTAPERAIPLFEKIIANGPEWRKAPEAQYLIGKAYEMTDQFEMAVVAYLTTEYRYPMSAFAETAAYGKTYCLYKIAQSSPNDERALEEAWAAIVLFQRNYTKSAYADIVGIYRKTVYRQRAKAAYNIAYFYDKLARKPKAALIEYQNLVSLFPDSDWTQMAQARIDQLKPLVEKLDEKPISN